ncbi:hypothetical protein ONS95_007804 [Cadophora gregata]|uniref:uncharacterized protein n=1 Tax=Cadophora gregata TaxID=51156 RepID=UPI0026DCEC9F|nr:uncharacterized protein ONS95_007804 [Cadophora gregata]KAK0126187.1 hypothetical protein ONS95_007804 [Cadophora gregata]
MMAPDRRRRSPEGSSISRRRKDPHADYNESPRMRATPQSYSYSSSSSSSSNSIVDISHSFPPKRSGIRTFFTAPSERRLRKRRSSRLMRNNNSSSSSVNSNPDLAYGHGYIKRPKLRRVRSRTGREIDREKYGDRHNERHYERHSDRYSDREGGKSRHNERTRESTGSGSASGRGKLGTTAEILAVGAGLRAIASEQNKRDLREARMGKKPEMAAVRDNNGHTYIESRGIGSSRVSHGPDEDGWESASDSESSVDSRLAFGNDTKGGWSFFGRKKHKPMSRKSSVVDPRLFGPANSLHGVVTQPVGFGDVSWTSTSDFGDQREVFQQESYSIRPQQSHSSSMSQVPLQQVPPMPMSESDRGEPPRYTSEPQSYTPIRPDPVPIQIQHPKPFTPVSQSVYEPIYPTRSESGGILKKPPSSSGRGKSLAEVAVAGVAAAAIGSMISSARDDRKDRQREEEIEAFERDRIRPRESEKRETKDEGRRDKRSSPPREDRRDKRRDKDKDETEERRRVRKRDERRGETRDEKEERREKRREERRAAERADDRFDSRRTKSEASVSTTSVDPFQFQVDQNAFPTPTIEASSGHKRIESVPTVVTVEREPDFSRKRSSSIKDQSSAPVSEPRGDRSGSQKAYSDWDEQEQRYRGGEVRDRVLHDAEATIRDAKHFTGPYDTSVITAVVAAEHHRETRADERRRERQQDAKYDDYDSKPRDATPAKDPIQEEADRAYREIVMARKIASQVIRSRSPSPDPSVVHKYENKDQEQEVIRIVTPPGMEEHKGKGPYDAPNADFRLDHVLEHPRDLETFNIPSFSLSRSNTELAYLVRDPDASKPRPLLNLVRPTPTPSPLPEKQLARSDSSRKTKSKDRESSKRSSSSDIVIGPKGNIIASPTASAVSKGVTWGENETKHYEVESPSEHRDEFVSNVEVKPSDGSIESAIPKGGKGWGAIAAGIIGAGVGATAASEISKSSKSHEGSRPAPYEYRGVVVEPESPTRGEEYRGVIIEPESPPRKQRQRSPPSPGPKPTMPQSPRSSQMPGAFDDDLDFTATVAAGLQDTGFDPNIVIDDPTFRRRDSPPGSNDHKFYQAPFAETVTDLGMNPSEISRTRGTEGFIIGEVASTPKDWPVVSPIEDVDSHSKLSKKEQKKRDKAAKRQGGVSTPIEEPIVSREVTTTEPESYFEAPLSKKEQKKRDKAAKRQGSQVEDAPPVSEPSVAAEIVQEPESYFETPKKSKKTKGAFAYDDLVGELPRERTVSVPVDAFDDLQNGQDEWADSSKKSKKKSKRDSEHYESPAISAPIEITSELERASSKKSKRDSDRYESPARSAPSSEISSSSKKSKEKSSRRSGQFDYDPTDVALPASGANSEISSVSRKSKEKSSRRSEQYEFDPTEVSLPPSTPSETSRDGDFEDARNTRRSSTRDSGIFNSEDRGESRSIVSTGTPRYDDPEPRKKKKSRSGTSDYDDTRSVTSAPAGDDYDEKKGKKKDKKGGGIFSGLFGSKSESGIRDESPKRSKDDFEDVKKKSKKSKRSSVPDSSSIYGDMGSVSVNDLSRTVSNSHSHDNGSYAYDDGNDDALPSDGEKRKKTRSRSESTSSKKDSFLDKAGTLGAGVGLAGVTVAAITAQHHYQQSNAENANGSTAIERTVSRGSDQLLGRDEILDPEITQRQFRPSIDPQYGDLLPLPPSDPASPNAEPLDDLPILPDSRPDTPESERLAREKIRNAVRRNVQDTPMKSPSQSQVPLIFKMGGNRSIPSSPSTNRASPLPSPANPGQESLGLQRHRSRPTSWDNSKEFKPLYLVESTRRGSNVQLADDEPLPELPPSQRTSRSSSQLDRSEESHSGIQDRGFEPLSINTTLASAPGSADLLGSGQSTPKANVPRGFDDILETPKHFQLSDAVTEDATQHEGPVKSAHSSSLKEDAVKMTVAAGLISSIGYFASTHTHPKTNESWLDKLPSAKDQQPPRDVSDAASQVSPMENLLSGESRPSSVDPVSKDRSSYLLQSSPMSKKSGDTNLNDRNIGSPISRQNLQSDRDALNSIQERFDDVGAIESAYDVSEDRKRTLETLSGLRDDLIPQPPSRDIEEPSDEFTSSKKSKKDKKKDKKNKGLSRSDANDDISLPELRAASIPDVTLPIESEPAEDFFYSSKSKKDRKSKKKNKSTLWDENEPLPQQTSEPSMPIGTDEPESDTFFDAEQGLPETIRSEEIAVQNDDILKLKGQKGKKDKKKNSAFAWEPEASEMRSEAINPAQIPSDRPKSCDVQQDLDQVQPSAELVTPVVEGHDEKSLVSHFQDSDRGPEMKEEKALDPSQFIEEKLTPHISTEEHFDELPSSKKKGKNDKRKSKAVSDWNVPAEKEGLQQTSEPLSGVISDFVSAPVEAHLAEEIFSSKSKKDKKKDKKKAKGTAWEAEQDPTPQVDPILSGSSQDTAGESSALNDTPQFDDFSTPKSKSKKGKKSKVTSWESAIDTPTANDLPTSAEENREADHDMSVAATESQSINEFTSVSRKDKKTKQKNTSLSVWDGELESDLPVATVSVSESGPDTQDTAEGLFEESSSSKQKDRKRDKKKSKSVLGWEPDLNEAETQPALRLSMDDTPAFAQESSSSLDLTHLSASHEEKQESTITDLPQGAQQELEQPLPEPAISSTPATHDIDNNALSKIECSDLPPDTTSQKSHPEAGDHIPLNDELESSKTKQSKNKGKSSMNWADEVESSLLESAQIDNDQAPIPDAALIDDFNFAETKKGKKKKKNKSTPVWEHDQESTAAQSSVEVETPVFNSAVSEIDKQSRRKTQQWDEPEIMQEQAPVSETVRSVDTEVFDDFTASSTKKGKKKSKKTRPFGGDIDERENLEEVATSSDAIGLLPGPETPLSRPTPLGGPGGWPITPATPLTGGEQPSGEVPSSSSKGYFPAAAAAVSAAIFGSKLSQNDSSSSTKKIPMNDPDSTSVGTDEPLKIETESRPLPDGLAAGYDNDQISLARQLQEEFGKKSSKKDKKKRQSLPSTPAVLPSRSRGLDDDTGGHPRARSLSIGPAADRSAMSPTTNQRKNVYSEDQLELARQLKADFESGSKKSKNKKGKKGRSTQDDDLYDKDFEPDMAQTFDDPVAATGENATVAESSDAGKPDGFAAGYQEDQLSLARQLQADFAKKASKKDNKRRSTSQTPAEHVPWIDTIANQSQFSSLDPLLGGDIAALPEAAVHEDPPLRDGLDVGYNTDQLELARQLKEEFGSGSKKKSKDKTAKKRGSLVQTNNEDDHSSDPNAGSWDDQPAFDALTQDLESSPNADADFAAIGKKSKGKKEKKSKRGSFLPSTPDDVLPSGSGFEKPALSHSDGAGAVFTEEQPTEPASTEVEDEFAPIGKKDKKSKKGTKRGSLLRSTIDDESSDISAKQDETSYDATEDKSSKTQATESPAAELDEGFEFSTKKTKKDKKKRQSSPAVEDFFDPSYDRQLVPNAELSNVDTADASCTKVVGDPNDDFGFPLSNKDKKNKRGSLLRNESFNINSEGQSDELGEEESKRDASLNLVIDEQQDNFDISPSKKSKKDKNKRGTLLRNESFNAHAEGQVESSDGQSKSSNDRVFDEAAIATPIDEEQQDDFDFLSTSSKKKRGRLRTSATLKDVSEPQVRDPVLQSEADTTDKDGAAPSALNRDVQSVEFATKPRKTGKDKNNRKSTRQTFDAEDSFKNSDDPSSSRNLDLVFGIATSENQNQASPDEPSSEPATTRVPEEENVSSQTASQTENEKPEDAFGDFAFTKKSKKKDKKPKGFGKTVLEDESRFSTPPLDPSSESKTADEASRPTKHASEIFPLGGDEEQFVNSSLAPAADKPVDNWDDFSTKKSKKKNRKDSSKLDSERVFIPSEPILEPSKDVALTPLPLDQIAGDSEMPEPREVESTTTTALKDGDGLADEWSSFTVKQTSKKDKKKQKASSQTGSTPSGNSNPLDMDSEPSQFPSATIFPDDIRTESFNSETPQSQLSDGMKAIATKEMEMEEPVDAVASFPSKKSKKGKKDRKSATSTPVELVISPLAVDVSIHEGDKSTSTSSQEVNISEDDWGAVPSKKSKKARKSNKSGHSTPIEEMLTAVSEHSSIDEFKKSPSLTEPVPAILKEATESSKEVQEDPVSNLDDKFIIPDPADEWGSVPAKRSKDKKKKRGSGISTPFEDISPPVSEQPGSADFSQSSTQRDLDLDGTDKTGPPIEETVTVEEQGEDWDDLSSKKSEKKKDKKQKHSGLFSPLEDALPHGQEADDVSQLVMPIESEEAAAQVEKSTKENGASEAQDDEEWATFSVKPAKKDRKKQKSGLSTPVEEVSNPKVDKKPVETGESSEPVIASAEDTVQAEKLHHVQTIEVLKDQTDDLGAFSVKSSKKGKGEKTKRSLGLSTPVEQSVLPILEQSTLESDVPSIQPASSEQASIDLIGPLTYAETREPVVDNSDKWGMESVKPSNSKMNHMSRLSTPIDALLTQDEPEPLSADPIQATASPSMPEDLGPGQTFEAMDEQDEWRTFSAPKSKKDKKKSRQSGMSTPVKEPVSDLQPELSAESKQNVADRAGPVETHSHDKVENRPHDQADEWTLPLKKSKDKKRQSSQPTTPVEEPYLSITQGAPLELIEPLDAVSNEALSSTHGVVKDTGEGEHEDDWGSFSKKKKKKDKKKAGFSTPVEALLPLTDSQTSSTSVQQVEAASEKVDPSEETTIKFESQVDDDWNSFSTKKGKKDKKGKKIKSGLSTPAEQVSTTLPKQENLVPTEQTSGAEQILQNLEESPSRGLEQDLGPSENSAADWAFSSEKKSKKDKKRESGISTPIDDSQVLDEVPSPLDNTSTQANIADSRSKEIDLPAHDADAKDQTPSFTELEDAAKDETLPEEDSFGFVSKKSKKSKKEMRKSGYSTPIDEEQVLDAPNPAVAASQFRNFGIKDQDESHSKPSSVMDHDILQQPPEEIFDSAPKKSKDKEAKKRSRARSESGPTLEQQELNADDMPRPTSLVALEHEAEAQNLFTSDLSRKLSKKDKRKRQGTVDIVSDSKGPVPAQMTSWVDEVEEAEVLRALPVIQEIAKDESLSHIAPTVEANPDDFVRPSKKGKKGTKRNSVSTDSTPVAESLQRTDNRDLLHDSSTSSHIPDMVATGAAIASTALLGKAATSHDDGGTANSGSSSGAAPPTRKLSKKEKKKKSIDRRAPREDDIFDDPALWEGADPKIHEEAEEGVDDDDGFWSPPQQEEEPGIFQEASQEDNTEKEHPTAMPPIEATKSMSPTVGTLPKPQSRDGHVLMQEEPNPVHHRHPSSSHDVTESPDLSGQFQPLSDHADEFIVSSKKKDRKKKSKSSSNDWESETSRDLDVAPPVSQLSTVLTPTVIDALVDREMPSDQQPASQEHIFTPTKKLFEQQHSNKDTPSQENFELGQSRPQSRSFLSRISDLPVVHEETSTQVETEESRIHDAEANRDSAFVTGSPIPPQRGFADNHDHVRDSGVHLRDFSPAEKTRAPVKSTDEALARLSWPSIDEESETVNLNTAQRSKETKYHIDELPSTESHDFKQPKGETATDFYRVQRMTPIKHYEEETSSRDLLPSQRNKEEKHTDLHRTSTIHVPRKTEGQSLVKQRMQHFQQFDTPDLSRSPRPQLSSSRSSERLKTERQRESFSETPSVQSLKKVQSGRPRDESHTEVPSLRSLEKHRDEKQSETPPKFERPKEAKYPELSSSPRPKAERPLGISEIEAGAAVAGASLGFAAARKLSQEQRPTSAQSQRSTSNSNINRLRTPDAKRPDSVTSNRSGTPPLRRSDRKSGDLRFLSQRSKPDLAKEAELATLETPTSTPTPAVNTANPTANEGRVRAKDMADVYDGFGEGRMGSPRSPTRPHSMRRRQSMQVLDLEQKLEQLAAENRMLADAKAQADRALHSSQNAPSALVEKDAEIDGLKRTLEWLQNEVTRLSEVNEGLTSANMTIARQHGDQYGILESQHTQTARELQEVRDAHENLSAGMEGIVRNEVQNAVSDKDREIAQLRAELDAAKEQIRDMQRQILASKANDLAFLTIRDEDYFDNACQQLCQHVQQWVLRFSKFSDMRACRLTSEINNDKTIDRLDNAILDGSDVDNYLADRVKRRDVFMSMTMTMVWEFIFTRYLFGMDREQRQKLKSLEKTLSEVGPAAAVHQWRATTLTLLAKREAFRAQREQDTQAVVHAVLETLSEILPPPSHLETQIEEQLTRVMKAAVDLSIEMRCQRAEYMMLPPLQPEYDANGDLASKVSFNAALMNERSGDTVSNEELEEQKAVVRIVLFPLVVKKGDDSGEGDEEIVVCPAQVLVAKPKKSVRVLAPEGNNSRISMQSSMPAGDSVI